MSKNNSRIPNWKPSKKRSPERIDGIVALIMATGRAALNLGGDRSLV
jgi:phage terminase large subunit-like protein